MMLLMMFQVAEELRRAIDATAAAKSYTFSIDVLTEAPNADPIRSKIRGVVNRDAATYLDMKGIREDKLVITDAVTWVYYDWIGWMNAQDCGDSRAGRGMENPKAVLAAARERAAGAERAADGSIHVRIDGADLDVVIRDGRVSTVRCRATEPVGVTATVTVEAYDRDSRLVWKDIPEPPQ